MLAAGVVRGFTGLGSSTVSVAGVSLLMSPARLVDLCAAGSASVRLPAPPQRFREHVLTLDTLLALLVVLWAALEG